MEICCLRGYDRLHLSTHTSLWWRQFWYVCAYDTDIIRVGFCHPLREDFDATVSWVKNPGDYQVKAW